MTELKWLIENVPVAAALLVMTKMWLNHLKVSEERNRLTFKEVSDESNKRSEDCHQVIKENTAVLEQVKQVIERGLA